MIRPDYKKVSELKPHCPNCKERLQGNNSIASRYKCSCGTWKPLCGKPFEYEIVKMEAANE